MVYEAAKLAGKNVLGPSVQIGKCCIINHGASVDHTCEIHDFVNICPGVRVGGAVRAQIGVFTGLNASIIQGVQIGAHAIIGAGAIVLSDIRSETTVIGVPARPI